MTTEMDRAEWRTLLIQHGWEWLGAVSYPPTERQQTKLDIWRCYPQSYQYGDPVWYIQLHEFSDEDLTENPALRAYIERPCQETAAALLPPEQATGAAT